MKELGIGNKNLRTRDVIRKTWNNGKHIWRYILQVY